MANDGKPFTLVRHYRANAYDWEAASGTVNELPGHIKTAGIRVSLVHGGAAHGLRAHRWQVAR